MLTIHGHEPTNDNTTPINNEESESVINSLRNAGLISEWGGIVGASKLEFWNNFSIHEFGFSCTLFVLWILP